MAAALQPTQIERWVTDLRFEPFMVAAGRDVARATNLYVWNAELAGALLETFGHVEVLLRNAVHTGLRDTRPANALRSWLLDPDLLGEDEIRRVDEVVGRLKRSKKEPTEDRVVAGLTLGFWASMVGKRYEELWRRQLRLAFPHGDGTRHQVAGYVNRIAQLRNRIAHHEALIDQAVADRYQDCLDLAATIDLEAAPWIESTSRVSDVIAGRP